MRHGGTLVLPTNRRMHMLEHRFPPGLQAPAQRTEDLPVPTARSAQSAARAVKANDFVGKFGCTALNEGMGRSEGRGKTFDPSVTDTP